MKPTSIAHSRVILTISRRFPPPEKGIKLWWYTHSELFRICRSKVDPGGKTRSPLYGVIICTSHVRSSEAAYIHHKKANGLILIYGGKEPPSGPPPTGIAELCFGRRYLAG
jgi:hypothetical protein